ncbi:MAG: TolB family protein, partial [Pirellulaceae bacterium]
AFTSGANGIVADAITGTHLYVRDLTLPNRPTSERVSVDDSENTYWGYSAEPSISGDGRYVAFETNLILDPLDTNPSSYDIYVRDRTAGDTTLISVNASGTGEGNNQSMRPAISADGAYIAFESYASNLDSTVTDGNGTVDVFLRSWKNTPSKTTLASRRETGTESADAYSN